jgi:protease IV
VIPWFDDMRAALQQACEDDRVKAIVLEIDYTGGEATAVDAIYSAVVKTRARKPVVVYMDSVAASGGYYVSCGGTFLMASAQQSLAASVSSSRL